MMRGRLTDADAPFGRDAFRADVDSVSVLLSDSLGLLGPLPASRLSRPNPLSAGFEAIARYRMEDSLVFLEM